MSRTFPATRKTILTKTFSSVPFHSIRTHERLNGGRQAGRQVRVRYVASATARCLCPRHTRGDSLLTTRYITSNVFASYKERASPTCTQYHKRCVRQLACKPDLHTLSQQAVCSPASVHARVAHAVSHRVLQHMRVRPTTHAMRSLVKLSARHHMRCIHWLACAPYIKCECRRRTHHMRCIIAYQITCGMFTR